MANPERCLNGIMSGKAMKVNRLKRVEDRRERLWL